MNSIIKKPVPIIFPPTKWQKQLSPLLIVSTLCSIFVPANCFADPDDQDDWYSFQDKESGHGSYYQKKGSSKIQTTPIPTQSFQAKSNVPKQIWIPQPTPVYQRPLEILIPQRTNSTNPNDISNLPAGIFSAGLMPGYGNSFGTFARPMLGLGLTPLSYGYGGGFSSFGRLGAFSPQISGYGTRPYGSSWGFNPLANPYRFNNNRLTTNRVFQSAPSKSSGNYYQPASADPGSSGNYYAGGGAIAIPTSSETQSQDYWGPNGNPFANQIK